MTAKSSSTRLILGLCSGWLALSVGAAPIPSANPYNEAMVLSFSDEFDGSSLNPAVWASQAYEKGLSKNTARGPDNLEVREGELRLYVRKEARRIGQHVSSWTSGFVYTRMPVETNVLIEARFKPGEASGVNNAFWLANIDAERSSVRDRYEFDIVETRRDAKAAKPSGRAHIAWHDWKTAGYAKNAKGAADHIAQGVHVDHSWNDYHTWALWLGEQETIYYLDGREVWRGTTHPRYTDQYRTGVGKLSKWFPDFEREAYGKHGQDDWSYFGGYAGDRMNIVFSNLPWSDAWTPLTEAAHGTYMAVDYVRVFRPARLQTSTPTQVLLTTEAENIGPGDEKTVTFPDDVPLATHRQFPSYFSFQTTMAGGANLSALFGTAEVQVFRVGGSVETGLRAGFARDVSTATAFPSSLRQEPWLAAGREMVWIGRYTPPSTPGGQATVSLCVFESGRVPEREPFFHANIDQQGNTSLNNGWHLNARDTTAAAAVRRVTFTNRGTEPLTVRQLKFGTSYRSVRP